MYSQILFKFSILFTTISLVLGKNVLSQVESVNQVLVVSFDGLGAKALDEFLANNPNSTFGKIAKNGLKAKYMVPSFPSATFPNHYTLVTGLYSESHGVVGNDIYDPDINKTIDLQSDNDNHNPVWWNQAEPIWLTATKKGYKTATYFWVGSEAEGRQSDIWMKYDFSVDYETRVKTVLDWININKTQLTFLYFEQPDFDGHKFGPDSINYKNQIERVDTVMGLLIRGLEESNTINNINIIIVSDHGMAQLVDNATIILKNVLKPDVMSLIDENKTTCSVVSNIWMKSDSEKDIITVFNALKDIKDLVVYRKDEVPKEYHYRNNKRIGPIVAASNEGYIMNLNRVNKKKGHHGYNNTFESMRGIFMAMGPDFKSGQTIDKLNNVDLYPLLCYLLKIDPQPNNGSLKHFDGKLKSPKQPVLIEYIQLIIDLFKCIEFK